MLVIRATNLSGDAEYMLDNAVECNGIDAGSRMLLVLYGDKKRVEAWFVPEEGRLFSRWRQTIYPALMEHAAELFAELDPVRQVGAMLLGMSTLRHNVRTTAEWLSSAAIGDSCEGGVLEEWRKPWKPKWDLAPPKRAARHLHSQRWIRNYIRRIPESGQMRAMHEGIMERAKLLDRAAITAELIREADSVFDADMDALAERRDARNTAGYARLETDRLNRLPPRQQKDRRKKLVRAATTATSVLGPAAVNQFIAGRPVDLPGQAVILTVQRRSDIGHVGHGGLHLRLRDMDRRPLAALCFYIDGTPALDQLTALALAMQNGEEAELLSHANITSATEAGATHPLLQERVKTCEAVARWAEGRERDINRRRARDHDYWQETKDIWINTLGRHVFGRGWGFVGNLWGDACTN